MDTIEILKYLGIGGVGILGGIGATLFWCFKYFVPRIVEKRGKHEILDLYQKALLLMKDAKPLGVDVLPALHQVGVDLPEGSTEEELREALRVESEVAKYLLFYLLNRSATYTSIMDHMTKRWQGEHISKAVEIAKGSYCHLWEGMAEKEENEGWIKEVLRSVPMSPEQEEAQFARLKTVYLYFKNPSEETYSQAREAMKRVIAVLEKESK